MHPRYLWVLAALVALVGAMAQAPLPRATAQDSQRAQLAVAEDGSRVTIRRPASDDLELCVESKDSPRLVCFRVGEIRSGKVTRR